MIDKNGNWAPDLVPKGYLVLNDYHRFLLLTGPRLSSKTTNVVSKICRHLWETDGAMVAIVGKSIRTIKSSGVWQDLILHKTGMRQWLESPLGFQYTVEPRLTGDSKMTYFRVRNVHGGESECQIHSLANDSDVEAKFKGTRYSMFYLPEADLFEHPDVFTLLDDQLRIIGKPFEQHQMILDCNPPEIGDEHWIYRFFFQHVGADGEAFDLEFANLFEYYRFKLEDNPFLDPRHVHALKSKYRHDKVKFARYVLGLWERDVNGGIFENVWNENVHVLGNIMTPREDDWEIIIPGKQSTTLVTGWDTGDVNHAVTFLCPREGKDRTEFDVIDEVVVRDRQMSLPDLTDLVVERMDFWENLLKELYGHATIRWRHWSDSSATKYRSNSDSYDYQLIRLHTEGRITLSPVTKMSGSVRKRIDLVKKLLFENRIRVSAKCKEHIQMFRYLMPGPNRTELIRRGSQWKHAFDSLSYALENEAPQDLERRNAPTVSSVARILQVG